MLDPCASIVVDILLDLRFLLPWSWFVDWHLDLKKEVKSLQISSNFALYIYNTPLQSQTHYYEASPSPCSLESDYQLLHVHPSPHSTIVGDEAGVHFGDDNHDDDHDEEPW